RDLRRVLAEESRQGWSVEDGHITEGLTSIAACAFDHTGHPTAAITVTFRHESHPPETWPTLATPIRQAAKTLTTRLTGRPPHTPGVTP
ncbi:IclR family transcriptional regulator C-terminal domain-containing protein, partial [Actinomadura adrarensis]